MSEDKQWHRARSENAKRQRRESLIDAAFELFSEKSYDAIEVLDIARLAGVAKGTFYLYFPSKESLFIAMTWQQFEEWFDELDDRFEAQPIEGSVEGLADAFSDSAISRPIMIRLIAILHVVLEQNIDLATAIAFKRMLRVRLLHTGALLERCAPFLSQGEGSLLLLHGYALCIGLQNLANPSQVVKQLITEVEGMDVFDIDFGTQLSAAMRALLRGKQGETV